MRNRKSKRKQVAAAVIAIVLVASMVLSVVLAALVNSCAASVHNIQKPADSVNDIS